MLNSSPRRVGADADRLVGEPHRQGMGRRPSEWGEHRADAELAARADDPQRDLAPVRDQDLIEHGSAAEDPPPLGIRARSAADVDRGIASAMVSAAPSLARTRAAARSRHDRADRARSRARCRKPARARSGSESPASASTPASVRPAGPGRSVRGRALQRLRHPFVSQRGARPRVRSWMAA